MPLSTKNFKYVAGKVYCLTHMPVDRSTALNSIVTQSALNAPKKDAGVMGVQKTGSTTLPTPKIGLDSMTTKSAMSAPKGTQLTAGVHKGASETAPKTTEIVNAGAADGSANNAHAPVGAAEAQNTPTVDPSQN